MFSGFPTEITVGTWEIAVRVEREGLIAQAALGTLTGATIRKRIIDKIGVEESLYPWKRHKITAFQYDPVIVNGKTTGAEVWRIRFDQLENPVPIAAILAGIAVLAGLVIIYLTVEDLKPVIDAAPGAVGAVGVGLVLLLLIPAGVWAYSRFSPSS